MSWRGTDLLQRLEWLALAGAALLAYPFTGQGWLFFLLLVLVPDASMIGYLSGPRVGAIAYNVAHTIILPLLLLGFGLLATSQLVSAIALIWLVHIAADRFMGYGLKLPTGFGDTHLGRVGRDQTSAKQV